jgi:GR25 family glycosyltransferase involved in LPS biosynthesis
MDINKIKKIVINLKRRPDRLKKFDREMNYIGWDYDIFEAVENIVGVDGCALSHVKVVENFLKTDDEHIMILEDDCFFMPYAKNQLEKSLKELNNLEWDYFNLGPLVFRPVNDYSDNLLDLSNLPTKDNNHHSGIYGLACYIINRKFGEEFLKFKLESKKPIDVYLDEDVYPNFKCFAPSIPVITQSNGFSDNYNTVINNHYTMTYKWNLYCKTKINPSYYDIGLCEREKDYPKKITGNL